MVKYKTGGKSMDFFVLLSTILKYIFIIIIYVFVFYIARMIYKDISSKRKTVVDEAYLQVMDDKNYNLKEFYIIRDGLSVGRADNNDIVIKDKFVSKFHIKISRHDKEYIINDFESSNGTYVNGELLDGEGVLEDGDIISIDDIKFLFVNKEDE